MVVVIHVDDADDADERANTAAGAAANAPTTKLVPGELAERIAVFFSATFSRLFCWFPITYGRFSGGVSGGGGGYPIPIRQ